MRNHEKDCCRQKILLERNEQRIRLTKGKLHMEYDIASGTVALRDTDNQYLLKGITAEAKLKDGTFISSKDLKRNPEADCLVTAHRDGFGEGIKLSVQSRREDGVILEQNFYAYEDYDYLLLEAVLLLDGGISTNYIAPLAEGKLECSIKGDLRFLSAPFDNDDFVRYASQPLQSAGESYEITSIFDNDTRKGMVAGSVSHDIWKTGIQAGQYCGSNDSGSCAEGYAGLTGFKVFGGITSKLTRDSLPHGYVTGRVVSSPKIFFGFFQDYRDGLEAYGRANGIIAPPLPWDRGVPMGWNSWSAVAKDLSYEIYTGASDFVKEKLQAGSFGDRAVYINFDAGWNKLTEEQLINAARHVKANGQLPGIYTTPFTFWGKDFDRPVEESEGLYTWRDLLLKDEQGNILPAYDGGYSIDPTHPGNYMHLKQLFGKFRAWGYQYVKLDFMSHGSVEGVHYNRDITTGIAAYNYGMQQLVDIMKEEIEKQEFFISLSIAPLFPACYAHSRRISCDIFGTINFAEYMLNSLTYGWWMNDSVYRFNDPDHIVVYNSYNHRDPILYHEGLTRYISSAISGTMMIDSDDFRIKEARERTAEILTNEEINGVAKAGITFRPVEGNTGDQACDTFIRQDEEGAAEYLAVFNYSASDKKVKELKLERLGLDPDRDYVLQDLWSGERETVRKEITLRMAEAEPKLYRICPCKAGE
ncbi:hypothetical protein HNQ56_002957 [Anaerotaenia torta]|uniref:alpha-galactosidase n=1 Tax=Anaerotaenia torta TaxID=433293 RepID=UPI003D25C3BB